MTAARRRFIQLRAAACALLVGLCILPSAAFAVLPPASPIDNCALQVKDYQGNTYTRPTDYTPYTSTVVWCVENTIDAAAITMLGALSQYMAGTVAVMIVLAAAIFGIRILSGEPELRSKAIGFLIRMGIVLMFSYNLANLAPSVFDILHQLINLVTDPVIGGTDYSPWEYIDRLLGKLLGCATDSNSICTLGTAPTAPGAPAPPASGVAAGTLNISKGVIGLVGAALFSSSAGIALALIAVMALLDLLWFIFQIVFIYLSACMLIGFLVVISPLMVPLAIFFYSEHYVKAWIDKLIAAILTPVLLFAFLALFLGIFNELIANIFGILGFPCTPFPDAANANYNWSNCVTPDFRAYWKINQPLFNWILPSDTNSSLAVDQTTGLVAHSALPAVQTFVDSSQHNALNTNTFNMPGIDFGAANVGITQSLIFAFTTLWLFASLMKSMMPKIPEIAANIAATTNNIHFNTQSPKEMLAEKMQQVQQDSKYLLVGGVISGIDKMVTKR